MKKMFLLLVLLLASCSSVSEKEMDHIQQVNKDLETIVQASGMDAASNPYDYIDAHEEEFNRIVAKKEIALPHFLNELEQSEEDGLKEYVMAVACVEMLGEDNPVDEWASGRQWYTMYQEMKR